MSRVTETPGEQYEPFEAADMSCRRVHLMGKVLESMRAEGEGADGEP